MSLLLDTHALIWAATQPERLPPATRETMRSADRVLVSAVSVYEITLKHGLGKLPEAAALAVDIPGYLAAQRFETLALTAAHAEVAGRLPLFHRDPFDRLLVAQALSERLTLVSNEALFDRFGVRRMW